MAARKMDNEEEDELRSIHNRVNYEDSKICE
jgi:hypothetical protein